MQHTIDPRKTKRHERKLFSEVEMAYTAGGSDRYYSRPYRNPYPKGERHDAYDRAYRLPETMFANPFEGN